MSSSTSILPPGNADQTGTASAFNFIDAHHHVWDLQAVHYPWLMARGEKRFFGDPTPIQKNYLPEDFLAESGTYHPQRSVHIQVGAAADQSLAESNWLQRQGEFPHAIVAYCDLAASDVEQQLRAHSSNEKLRGIRQIVGRHPEEDRQHGTNDLLADPTWAHGLTLLARHGLSFDLQLIPPQMTALFGILRDIPELRVALCHCASPWDQSRDGLVQWRRDLRQLASLPNVHCKVSGLGMFNPQWTVAELRPIILDVLDLFGAQRVMFGSNFPVDKLYRSYDALWNAYRAICSDFSAAERRQMFYETAAEFYRLD
jgi:predicted TIM-barrel fold metal-dependent hydrolase